MFKILSIVGTRPELIKSSMVLKKFDQFFEHKIVHTGQNHDYELNEIFYKELGLRKPDYYLEAKTENNVHTIASILKKTSDVMANEKPDAIFLYGDTDSCLSAIASKKMGIPIIHMEAGNRSFDSRVPEEVNRKIIDHIAELNFVHSEHARRNLLDEGIKSEGIVKSGSPIPEIYQNLSGSIEKSGVLSELGVNKEEYILVSLHRKENIDNKERLKTIIKELEGASQEYGKRILISIHPRLKQRLIDFGLELPKEFVGHPPFSLSSYLNLQRNSFCVVSDSGSIVEDVACLNFYGISYRDRHERFEGTDVGSVLLCPPESGSLVKSIQILRGLDLGGKIEDYSMGSASDIVVKAVLGYIKSLTVFNPS